jgi:hypothetical protein
VLAHRALTRLRKDPVGVAERMAQLDMAIVDRRQNRPVLAGGGADEIQQFVYGPLIVGMAAVLGCEQPTIAINEEIRRQTHMPLTEPRCAAHRVALHAPVAANHARGLSKAFGEDSTPNSR